MRLATVVSSLIYLFTVWNIFSLKTHVQVFTNVYFRNEEKDLGLITTQVSLHEY